MQSILWGADAWVVSGDCQAAAQLTQISLMCLGPGLHRQIMESSQRNLCATNNYYHKGGHESTATAQYKHANGSTVFSKTPVALQAKHVNFLHCIGGQGHKETKWLVRDPKEQL